MALTATEFTRTIRARINMVEEESVRPHGKQPQQLTHCASRVRAAISTACWVLGRVTWMIVRSTSVLSTSHGLQGARRWRFTFAGTCVTVVPAMLHRCSPPS